LAYECRMAALEDAAGELPDLNTWDIPPARMADLEMYFQHLEQALVDIDFHDRDNPRQTMTRLRRLYGRIRLDEMELSSLRGLLHVMKKLGHNLKMVTSE